MTFLARRAVRQWSGNTSLSGRISGSSSVSDLLAVPARAGSGGNPERASWMTSCQATTGGAAAAQAVARTDEQARIARPVGGCHARRRLRRATVAGETMLLRRPGNNSCGGGGACPGGEPPRLVAALSDLVLRRARRTGHDAQKKIETSARAGTAPSGGGAGGSGGGAARHCARARRGRATAGGRLRDGHRSTRRWVGPSASRHEGPQGRGRSEGSASGPAVADWHIHHAGGVQLRTRGTLRCLD
jgi:hypothetical protein